MENTKPVGKLVETYHDEYKQRIKEEYYVCGKKKVGMYKLYNSSGDLEIEVPYTNGKMNGTYKEYYTSETLWYAKKYAGQAKMEIQYIDGKMNGTYKKYNHDGTILIDDYYVDGKKMEFVEHTMKVENYQRKQFL